MTGIWPAHTEGLDGQTAASQPLDLAPDEGVRRRRVLADQIPDGLHVPLAENPRRLPRPGCNPDRRHARRADDNPPVAEREVAPWMSQRRRRNGEAARSLLPQAVVTA